MLKIHVTSNLQISSADAYDFAKKIRCFVNFQLEMFEYIGLVW